LVQKLNLSAAGAFIRLYYMSFSLFLPLSLLPYMKNLFFAGLALCLVSCSDPVPISYAALPGMTRKEVEKRLGNPVISGGFIHSEPDSRKKTPQKERFLLFYTYRDSSLVVFKKDTVFERFDRMAAFRKRYGSRPRR
jgi:hypothetical protein